MNGFQEALDKLAQDPGDPVFAEAADDLRRRGELREALEICLKGLSANPSCHKGRLVLARVFYEMQCVPFAVRELDELCREIPQSRSLRRLREILTPEAFGEKAQTGETTVAEADFDFEEIDLIADEAEEEDLGK